MIKIDKGIPIPEKGRFKYPYAAMKVGDSFAVPDGKNAKTAAACSQAWGRRHNRTFLFRQYGPRKAVPVLEGQMSSSTFKLGDRVVIGNIRGTVLHSTETPWLVDGVKIKWDYGQTQTVPTSVLRPSS